MKAILKKRVSLLTVWSLALIFVFCNVSESMANDLKPIQEFNMITWTKSQLPIKYEEAMLLAETWKKLGLQVRVVPLNYPNPMLEVWFDSHDFDTFILGIASNPERLDPDFYTYHSFHSSNAGKGGWNLGSFNNKEFDRLAEAQREEYDLDKRRAIVYKCQQLLHRENPWLILVNKDGLQAYNKADFKDPVIPKLVGLEDAYAYFTFKPTGARKVISMAVPWTDIKTYNPLLMTESSVIFMLYFIYDTLVKIGPETTKPEPWAAKEIKPIDLKTIDVTIRNDLKFHDGKPLTAEDIKFTFEFMIKHGALYFKPSLNPIESVNIMDKYKVRFHLKNPYPPFITQTLVMIPLLPKHIWEKIEKPTEYRNVPPIGSGPFKFDHWREAQEFKVSRFPDHFKPAYVDGVLFVFYGTREAAYTALKMKKTDQLNMLLPHQMEELQKLDYIQTVRVPSPRYRWSSLQPSEKTLR